MRRVLLLLSLLPFASPAKADDTVRPEVAEAASFGLVAIVAADLKEHAGDPPRHWWDREDLGPHEPGGAATGMWKPSIHEPVVAGLHLSGVGQGVHASPPAVALKHGVRTVGGGGETDESWDAFDGRARLAQRPIREPQGTSSYRVPPDTIERVVHANEGRFETCYRLGLRTDPGLHGRVVVKFVIDRAGSVAFAADAGSDLPNDDVVTCVVRAFDTLLFPEGSDRVITVVYPIPFGPDDAANAPP